MKAPTISPPFKGGSSSNFHTFACKIEKVSELVNAVSVRVWPQSYAVYAVTVRALDFGFNRLFVFVRLNLWIKYIAIGKVGVYVVGIVQ